MAIPFYDSLTYYATPPNSYIGSAIFLSYIVFALFATASITYSLYSQYTAIFNVTKDANLEAAKAARARHIKIYTFLASISFATLSYHMLFFLITHYLDWTADKHRSLSAVTGGKLKSWMLQSTLFQDFANELVQSKGNAVVTQLAILGTWYWNIWTAKKGTCALNTGCVTLADLEQLERGDSMHRQCATSSCSAKSYQLALQFAYS
jgi:hypothetical protein